MVVDKEYCMSSYLTYRYIFNNNVTFKEGINRPYYPLPENKHSIKTADDIDIAIKELLKNKLDSKTCIMLSGGMDSAILATYLPKGTKAYTMKLMADGAKEEIDVAKKYAEYSGLDHHIVEITWDDYKKYTPLLMKKKGAPIHSIEPMIYKVALEAKADGCDKIISGESADDVFAGLDGLLGVDRTRDEFIERFTFTNPQSVLKHPVDVTELFEPYAKNKIFDAHGFVSQVYSIESINSYMNACSCAGMEFVAPYSQMEMIVPVDLERIRNGENKYLIRELFEKRYSGMKPANKLPMPRAVGIWLEKWHGPTRDEFIPGCADGLTGDQKWQLYCLEQFLNMLDAGMIK